MSQGKDNYEVVLAALREKPDPLLRFAAHTIVALGAKSEWDMEDNYAAAEGIAELAAKHYGLPPAGDQDEAALRFYGLAAQHLGYDADIDDEPDEDEEDDS